MLFWRENARGPYRVIRTSRQPIRKLYLGYGPEKNKYRLFAVWEVRTEKYFPEVLEAARDRRSRDATKTEGKYFYSMDRPER